MKRILSCLLIAGCALAHGALCAASRQFSFGFVNGGVDADEATLAKAISDTDDEELGFIVANGVKSGGEPCSDELYSQRKALLDDATHGVIVSLAASDWTGCKRENGKSAAMERLNRVRELFFSGEASLGGSRIALVRQSVTPKFRAYGENARWEMGGIAFATIDLPADNNHYLAEAGRNSEFEDRLIANQNWLHRIFLIATQKKLGGIVLFCDGNPFAPQAPGTRRDGFAEVRRRLAQLAAAFPGKVLVVHGQRDSAAPADIDWHDNLGILSGAPGWQKITVDPNSASLFAVRGESIASGNRRP